MFKRINSLYKEYLRRKKENKAAKLNPDQWINLRKNVSNWWLLKYKLYFYLQSILWVIGVGWHNPVRNECALDGSCCRNK